MTLNFWRMCVANLLLYTSVYMLFPLLPFVMGEQLGVSAGQVGSMFLVFAMAMFAVGPFHAYLVDEYKRKHVLLYSTFIMLTAVLGYAFVDSYTKFLLLAAVQGACFGLATTAGITVAIDITTSARRSAGNMVYAWAARLGMLVGVVLGIGIYKMYGFRMVTYLSVATGLAGIFFASRVYVAFRAPIGVSLCNMDRFLLPRAWVPAINMILITFVPGLLIPLVHPFLNDSVLGNMGIPVPFFVGVGIGYLISLLLARLSFMKEKTLRLVIVGIGLEMLAMSLLDPNGSISAPSVLLGLGLGLVMPEFLVMFVKLSHHCQRGTANTTHLLASEVGISLGIATACYLDLDTDKMLHIGQIVASVALVFFVIATYPYYIRKKVR